MAVYTEISYQDSLERLKNGEFTHASHAMIYAPWPGALFDKYEHKYAVMVRLYKNIPAHDFPLITGWAVNGLQ